MGYVIFNKLKYNRITCNVWYDYSDGIRRVPNEIQITINLIPIIYFS